MKSASPPRINQRKKGKGNAHNDIVDKLQLISMIEDLQFSGTTSWPVVKRETTEEKRDENGQLKLEL
jgi:hypothetical protein